MAEKQNEQKKQKNAFLSFSRFVLGAFFAFLLIIVLYAFSSPLHGLLTQTETEQSSKNVDEVTDGTDKNAGDVSDDEKSSGDKETKESSTDAGDVTDSTDKNADSASDDEESGADEETLEYPYRQDSLLTEVNREGTTSIDASQFSAGNIALLCSDDMTLLASLNADERIHPASMTKVMTLLVAAEHVSSLDEEVPINGELFKKYTDLLTGTEQFITYQYEEGDVMTVPVKTLLYLIGMESAADATLVLTDYLAGSPEAFVEWMNQKAEELQLRDTHFTNAIGIYDENLYSTALDMAVIMANAMQIDIIADLLGTAESRLPFVWEGKTVHFLSRHTLFYDFYNNNTSYSRKLTGGFYVEAAKTGTESYKVNKSKTVYIKALASMTTDSQNRHYILVTVSETDTEAVLKNLVSDLNTIYQNAETYIKP